MDKTKMQKALDIALKKIDNSIKHIGNDLREYVATKDGQYFPENREQFKELSHVYCWTQSFYTGVAAWAYKVTQNEEYLKWLNSFDACYYDKVFKTPIDTMHDLGFLYSPYAVALYKHTGDNNMKKIAIKAADELAKRFVPNGGYIQAWGRMDDKIPSYIGEELVKDNFFANSKGLAIIDSMMNLPLLFWASEVTGHSFYKRIAMMHADTTLKYFVRDDFSVCHAYRFDLDTGEPIEEFNDCGYSVGSHWARGTAWAVYGFIIAYNYTHKKEYLDVAMKLADKYIDLCKPDGMPIWDFRLPKETPARYGGREREFTEWDITDEKNTIYNIDTSASVVLIGGLFEILKHKDSEQYTSHIDLALNTLCTNYMNYNENISGLLSTQNGTNNYSIIGDYFFLEALIKGLYDFDTIW